MHLALVTSANLPGWEKDDAPLHAAFEARGVTLSHPIWNDPAVDWSAFDAALIRTTWDYCDDRDAFVSWAESAGEATRLMNPAEVIKWNTHKSYLRDVEAMGLPIIPTFWMERGGSYDLSRVMEENGWARGFLKPQIGAMARHTLRFDADEEGFLAARKHVNSLIRHEGLMFQPYLESVETFGEVSAIFLGGAFSHGVRKIPVEGDYRVQDDHGASDEPFEFEADFLTHLADLVDRFQHDLVYARFDFLRDGEGHYLLTELELVEPSLFFRHDPTAAERLAEVVVGRIGQA
jgi:hypothetical protein